MKPTLQIRPSRAKGLGSLCVHFYASEPGQSSNSGPYAAFWTSDQREAEIFVALGDSPMPDRMRGEPYKSGMTYLYMLDQCWQSRQYTLLDNIIEEMENETLKKRSQELPPRTADGEYRADLPGA